jgi:hypothetical protein
VLPDSADAWKDYFACLRDRIKAVPARADVSQQEFLRPQLFCIAADASDDAAWLALAEAFAVRAPSDHPMEVPIDSLVAFAESAVSARAQPVPRDEASCSRHHLRRRTRAQ